MDQLLLRTGSGGSPGYALGYLEHCSEEVPRDKPLCQVAAAKQGLKLKGRTHLFALVEVRRAPECGGNAGERESIGAEQPLEVPEPSPPCPQGRSCPPPAADRSVLESGRRVPAGCRVLGGHRALTLARWAVRFLSHRFPGVLILTSPKPQASLPGPLPLPYLLDAVQNGIRQPSLRFAFSLTLCAARVAQQILKPEEHVYIRVKRFLLSHRYLDLRKVPGFLQLFYSFDFEYKTARVGPQISWGRAVTNIAVSSMSTRGFSGSFFPFSAVLCVTRAPRVLFWRYDRVLPASPLELPMSR
ncbi:uncharacterized protein LOC128785260 [Vidua chalybeata]|uniref:uncharacterized protein LOC128785257 n=1 Tax=Vidua chalybeata TaxID=81927 RepID=UPI0023A879EE|nr:uncharacterized protein LOC128785257 [Vidua chalybeata]XP_053793534.1 uncharacterized protein LOC128785258 [Vidua chalybeata]XP_053793535.1 uncharacterized protein LOC128785260 [Vidua chalybeata]